MKTIKPKSEIDEVINEYDEHLTGTAGLKPGTCQHRRRYARQFLEVQFRNARTLDWSRLTAQGLLQYFLEQSRRTTPSQLQYMASALRCFCRFLQLSGRSSQDLSVGIPPIGSDCRELLPEYLTEEQLAQLLNSFNNATSIGQRDYAIVICLAKLGLRACEVAQLSLDDIDWREGTLTLARTKGRRERKLPLPSEVGTAIVKYLREGRGAATDRHLFLSIQGAKPLSSETISRVVADGLKRAGIHIRRKGAHLLRRTVASHLVQRGVSLKHVADLLGHSSLDTTVVYTKVNLPMLREVAMPWPMEAAR